MDADSFIRQREKNESIKQMLDKAFKEEEKEIAENLRKLKRAILFSGRHELAQRGTQERLAQDGSDGGENAGVLLGLISLIRSLDPDFRRIMDK